MFHFSNYFSKLLLHYYKIVLNIGTFFSFEVKTNLMNPANSKNLNLKNPQKTSTIKHKICRNSNYYLL